MTFRICWAAGLSLVLHLMAISAMVFFQMDPRFRHITIFPPGGVVWLNLNPGGHGAGGEGPVEADPFKEDGQSIIKNAPIPDTRKLKPDITIQKRQNRIRPLNQKLQVHRVWEKPLNAPEGESRGASLRGNEKGQGSGKGAGVGLGEGQGGIGAPGVGGQGAGGDPRAVLAKIHRKILRAKRYPPEARQGAVEGRCGLQFQISPDGGLKYIKLIESCGHPLLDQEALATVRRAVPFPYYPEAIQFNLRFNLKGE